MNYDIIGDIHGHAEALKALLHSMDYRESKGAWRHPERQAVFVGDFIDRGPEQVEAVEVVRRMVDDGCAQAIMGNHEFNAIAWFLPNPRQPGEYLRPHHSPKYGDKNYGQHKAFLDEVIGTPRHKEIIDWFLTLPLWLELDGFRVVHACWYTRFMDLYASQLANGNRLTADLMVEASREPEDEADKDTATPSLFKAVEAITKGIEIQLPHPPPSRTKMGTNAIASAHAGGMPRQCHTNRLPSWMTKGATNCPTTQFPNMCALITTAENQYSSVTTGRMGFLNCYPTRSPA